MRTAVFFILEGALLRGEAQSSFAFWAARRGYLQPSGVRQGLLSRLRRRLRCGQEAAGSGPDGFASLRGCSVVRIESAAAEFFAANLVRRLRPQAQSVVAARRRRGHVTVLSTAADAAVARPIASYLQTDILLAAQPLAQGAISTGRGGVPEAGGAGKRFVAQEYCARFGSDLSRSYAYASRVSDADLLEVVGHPVAANPDRRLRDLAAERGWRIMALDANPPELEP